jgi:competence protein ComEA
MSDLLRPPPATTWRDRVHGLLVGARPSRLLTAAGAVLLVVTAAWWLLRAPAPPVEAGLPMAGAATAPAPTVPVTTPADVAGPSSTAPPATVVVQAAGALALPGVYRLDDGARVADLVAEAGGPTPEADLDAVALASKLVDGQRVYVPRVGEAVPAAVGADPGAVGQAAPSASSPLDLNTATAAQLDGLPTVGPATAAAIVAHRERNGPFLSVEALLEVRGIGPARLDELRPLVRV